MAYREKYKGTYEYKVKYKDNETSSDINTKSVKSNVNKEDLHQYPGSRVTGSSIMKKSTSYRYPENIVKKRVRIHNFQKFVVIARSYVKYQLNLIQWT